MKHVKTNMPAWLASIKKSRGSLKITEGATVRALTPKAEKFAQNILRDEEFWEDIVRRFLREVVFREISKQFRMVMQDPSYWPKIIEGSTVGPIGDGSSQIRKALAEGGGNPLYDKDAVADLEGNRVGEAEQVKLSKNASKIVSGYQALLSEILKSPEIKVIANQEINVGIGPMERILTLKLNEYMPTSGGHHLSPEGKKRNNLYYAVEFGTGIAENVGSGSFVRHEGHTKDRSGRYPGSWWLGRRGFGAHFIGQKGANIFHERTTRLPKWFWKDLIYREWPKFLHNYLQQQSAALGYF